MIIVYNTAKKIAVSSLWRNPRACANVPVQPVRVNLPTWARKSANVVSANMVSVALSIRGVVAITAGSFATNYRRGDHVAEIRSSIDLTRLCSRKTSRTGVFDSWEGFNNGFPF